MSRRAPAFPIVGVGASAGGVESLEGLFKGMPAQPGVALAVVTHLSPERESLLHEIIARHTDLTVEIAADDATVQANHVYVLPADAILGIENGRLQMHKPAPGQRERKPIDIFLSALAKDCGEQAGAIILSGGDSDGALGAKAIKERGGLTMAQTADGHGPTHPEMPASAIATGYVDLAIPVGEMGRRLADFARGFSQFDDMVADSTDAAAKVEWAQARDEIWTILRQQMGHDFSGYKPSTFSRRVHRRMQVAQVTTLEGYLQRLRRDQTETNALFRDLLINVTNFFRDGEAFEALSRLVVPGLFDGRGADDTVRVWAPGCATGEEVYSIAILLSEHMDTLAAAPRVQIFATDINERSLAVARAGHYPQESLEGVSDARRARFFIRDGGGYAVAKNVRELCIFSPHSVIRDPPFSRMDLISCRNLLIYFGADAQRQIIPIFHYSLRPHGVLFLGASENVSQFNELFTAIDKKHRIYRSRDDATSKVRLSSLLANLHRTTSGLDLTVRPPAAAAISLRDAVNAQVMGDFAPAHVTVDRDGEVVYYSTRTGKYLEAAQGSPSRELVTMVRKGLRVDVRAAFRECVESGRRVVRPGVMMEDQEGRTQLLAIIVEPLAQRDSDRRLYLVLFIDDGPPRSRDAALTEARGDAAGDTLHLEAELRETRERLQSLVEEYETALEELKSSNEELVSLNEELQSTNEELEASKEEMQSLNEEPQTVNAELHGKVDALDAANSDLQNLFASTQVATIFLDKDLIIRSYTPPVSQMFNILPSDRGRPITDLASRLAIPALAEDLRAVLRRGRKVERRIDHDDATFLLRILPYRDSHQRNEGVIVTLVDVTTLTRAEAHLQVLIAELNHRVKNMLTVVIAIASQTSAGSVKDFQAGLVDRLHAMARSYELLSRENWTRAPLEDLIRLELAPFGLERITLRGPPIQADPKQALSVGMVVHELATNAGKYGALSSETGTVEVSWSRSAVNGAGLIEIAWRERGGPEVSEPIRRGFGLKLVEREAAYNLGGAAKIEFQPQGLSATLSFPAPVGEIDG
ncbi:MAG TPA: CheR family methyltransferase [Caulobacteraceae bacterium]